MSRKWYGSLNNRLEENRQFVDTNKTRYHKRNISIGKAEYYYDYEF